MADIGTTLSDRFDTAALPLAIGDLIAILIVLTIGMIEHGTLVDPVHVVLVYLPFVIGWFLAAPIVGAYAPGAAETAKAAIPLAIRAWVPASVIGYLLRWSDLFPGGLDPTFIAITFVLIAVLLGVWRWLFFKLFR